MKIALVHDWIISIGGAERVLQQLHVLWPHAPIFTLLHRPAASHALVPNATIISSSLQRLPRPWSYHTILAPFMPSAVESFDLSAYDCVISSSVMFSKGVVVRPDTRHISYCYSPTRMLWDRHASYERSGVLSRTYRHGLRLWDQAAAQRPDQLIAISQTAAKRIQKYYRRPAMVIPPPTRTVPGGDTSFVPKNPYFLVVARLVPHKHLDVLVAAFSKLHYDVILVGQGPLRSHIMRTATSNITSTGWVTDAQLAGLYDNCQAVIVPNEEDWGLTALEAMSHGKPVLALRRGGATESILEGITGEYFDDSIPESLADGVKRVTSALRTYDPAIIRAHAQQYGVSQFQQRMRAIIEPLP